jgi:hypothetical protein
MSDGWIAEGSRLLAVDDRRWTLDKEENGIMKSMKLSVIFAALCVVGMGALLVGCGDSAGGSTNTDAQQQFLAERGSGTPIAGTPGVVSDTGGFGPGGFRGVFGRIEKIEGNTITVNNPVAGTSQTIKAAAEAKVFKQDTISIADIKVGDAILAVGTPKGTAMDANLVEVADAGAIADLQSRTGGGFGGFPGGGPRGGIISGTPGSFPQGTPGAARTPGFRRGQGTPGAFRTPGAFPQGTPGAGNRGGSSVIGIIEKIDGNAVTIKPTTSGGITTINMSADARVQKQSEIKLSDLKAGDSISASGAQKGDLFEATRLQVVSNFQFQPQTP